MHWHGCFRQTDINFWTPLMLLSLLSLLDKKRFMLHATCCLTTKQKLSSRPNYLSIQIFAGSLLEILAFENVSGVGVSVTLACFECKCEPEPPLLYEFLLRYKKKLGRVAQQQWKCHVITMFFLERHGHYGCVLHAFFRVVDKRALSTTRKKALSVTSFVEVFSVVQ